MALTTYTLPSEASGVPAGSYVAADVAATLEQTLSKLCWTVLYGKSFDASSLAVSAEQLLQKLGRQA